VFGFIGIGQSMFLALVTPFADDLGVQPFPSQDLANLARMGGGIDLV
jgi:hypothetical protein